MILSKVNMSLTLKNILYLVTDNVRHHEWNKLRVYSHSFYSFNKCNGLNKLVVGLQSGEVPKKQYLTFQTFCTEILPKDENVFGDLTYNKHEKIEMDKEEQEEEEFVENEARLPRRVRPSTGQYASMIKSHIGKGELDAALNVLQLVKHNRDKPTVYMYNLLIRAFAVQGKLNECFSLYNKMKSRQLEPNGATYNSLLNACAESKDGPKALEMLDKIRRILYEKQFPLGEAHYNTLIKAYSWHNHILKAFEVVDCMRDNRIDIKENTYNCLLHAAIADKEAGMRHALIIWHMMRKKKIKPTITTYCLFLRAIRDTKFGNLKVSDMFSSTMKDMEMPVPQNTRPDLLHDPPVIGTIPIVVKKSKRDKTVGDALIQEIENTIVLSPDTKLDDIFVYNRLILFGGFENIIKLMENDNVKPDAKAITLIMESLPGSVSAENIVLKYAKDKNIEMDIDFYNILIKRRCIRKEYKSAKAVLNEIQKCRLVPNIMTFGVLALGCEKSKDGKELLEGMEIAGYVPNEVIVGTLIAKGCHKLNTPYILELMKYMEKNHIKPTEKLYKFLDRYEETLKRMITSKKNYTITKAKLKESLENFQPAYAKWRQKFES